MYWLRWHYHVKDIAGAPYKIKKKERKEKKNKTESLTVSSRGQTTLPSAQGIQWYIFNHLALPLTWDLWPHFWNSGRLSCTQDFTCCERCNCQVWSSESDRRSYITLITVVCLLQYRRLGVDRSSASALAAECGQLCIFGQYSALAKCKNNPSAKPLASASFCHHIRGVSAAVYTCHIVHFAPFTTREVLCTR